MHLVTGDPGDLAGHTHVVCWQSDDDAIIYSWFPAPQLAMAGNKPYMCLLLYVSSVCVVFAEVLQRRKQGGVASCEASLIGLDWMVDRIERA